MWWAESLAHRWYRPQGLLHVSRHHVTSASWRGPLNHEFQLRKLPLEGGTTKLDDLHSNIQELLQDLPGGGSWQVLLDSSWCPVTHFSLPDEGWKATDIKALAVHKWSQLYGAESGDWHAQTDFLSGDASATVFGTRDLVLQTISQVISQRSKIKCILPSVLWVHQQVSDVLGKDPQTLHWHEDDRSMLFNCQEGRLALSAQIWQGTGTCNAPKPDKQRVSILRFSPIAAGSFKAWIQVTADHSSNASAEEVA